MKKLIIKWQRLTEGGETCSRCGGTERELGQAVKLLERSLGELDIEVELNKSELKPAEFEKAPLESNRIWLNGDPLAEIIGAKVGHSLCCDVCGENQCRTLKLDGKEYETIPRQLIVRAGLQKAADLVEPDASGTCCEESVGNGCCSG